MRIFITNHAYQRWLEYVEQYREGPPLSKKQLAYRIRAKFWNQLRGGMQVDNATKAIHLPFRGLVAVLVADQGQWDVVTFHRNEKGYVDIEKPAGF